MDYLKNIVHECPQDKAILGLDVGKKTIGLAICDPDLNVATPLSTIKRQKFTFDIKQIERAAQEFYVGGYVIGYPTNMDGSEGLRCQSVRDFAQEFIRQLSPDLKDENGDVWVALWDERLSTFSVEDFVDNTVGMKRSRAKEEGLIDKLAAQIILQGAIDFIKDKRRIPDVD